MKVLKWLLEYQNSMVMNTKDLLVLLYIYAFWQSRIGVESQSSDNSSLFESEQ